MHGSLDQGFEQIKTHTVHDKVEAQGTKRAVDEMRKSIASNSFHLIALVCVSFRVEWDAERPPRRGEPLRSSPCCLCELVRIIVLLRTERTGRQRQARQRHRRASAYSDASSGYCPSARQSSPERERLLSLQHGAGRVATLS